MRMLVRGSTVPVGFGAMMMGRSGVLLGLVVAVVPVVVLCLAMVMRGCFVVAGRGVMMFGSRMSCRRGHELSPCGVGWVSGDGLTPFLALSP